MGAFHTHLEDKFFLPPNGIGSFYPYSYGHCLIRHTHVVNLTHNPVQKNKMTDFMPPLSRGVSRVTGQLTLYIKDWSQVRVVLSMVTTMLALYPVDELFRPDVLQTSLHNQTPAFSFIHPRTLTDQGNKSPRQTLGFTGKMPFSLQLVWWVSAPTFQTLKRLNWHAINQPQWAY